MPRAARLSFEVEDTMKIVCFKKNWDRYFGGEVAGFEDEEAARLVKAGVAELQAAPAGKPGPAPAAGKGSAEKPPADAKGKK